MKRFLSTVLITLAASGCSTPTEEIDHYARLLMKDKTACEAAIEGDSLTEMDQVIDEHINEILAYARKPTEPPSLEARLNGTGLTLKYQYNPNHSQLNMPAVEFDIAFQLSSGLFEYGESSASTSIRHEGVFRYTSEERSFNTSDRGNRQDLFAYAECETRGATYRVEPIYEFTGSIPLTPSVSADEVERLYRSTRKGSTVSLRIRKSGSKYDVRACEKGACTTIQTTNKSYMQFLARRLEIQFSLPTKSLYGLRDQLIEAVTACENQPNSCN